MTSTFGATLRGERENRGLSVRELAEKMGVDRERLIALERNDFASLPDDATMVPLLHTYADCLGVEGEMMIEDYLRERSRCLEQLSREIDRVRPTAIVEPRVRRPSPFPRLLVLSAAAGGLAVLGLWWMLNAGPTGETEATSAEPVAVEAPPVTEPAGDSLPVEPTPVSVAQSEPAPAELAPAEPPPAEPRAPVAPAVATPAPSRARNAPAELDVTEHGVGRAVENRRLVGERKRFKVGSQVWYWTEIAGGEKGDRVEHVWLADGEEAARIELKLGGPRWRTYSAKTLHAGSAKKWAVEVRDPSGQVLARREFVAVR